MSTALRRLAAMLWAAWGVLHFLMAFPFVLSLREGIVGLPATVTMEMGGDEVPFHVRRTLMEHAFNSGWFGLVVPLVNRKLEGRLARVDGSDTHFEVGG